MLDHKDEILKGIGEAKDWHALHERLSIYGVSLRKRANGLVFVEAREGKQAMKASVFDRSTSKPALEKRLGPFEALKKEKTVGMAQTAHRSRYKARPLLKGHPATAQLWRRYLIARKPLARRPGLIGRALGNWKLFLLTEAYQDPLAMVLIMAHQEFLNLLLGTRHTPSKRVPKTLEGPLAHWQKRARAGPGRKKPSKRPSPAEMLKDDRGNILLPQRDGQGRVVGLLMKSADGRFIALDTGTAANRRKMRQELGSGM